MIWTGAGRQDRYAGAVTAPFPFRARVRAYAAPRSCSDAVATFPRHHPPLAGIGAFPPGPARRSPARAVDATRKQAVR